MAELNANKLLLSQRNIVWGLKQVNVTLTVKLVLQVLSPVASHNQ